MGALGLLTVPDPFYSKLKYPEQVTEPESPITVRIFLFDAVSFKKRYLPTAP